MSFKQSVAAEYMDIWNRVFHENSRNNTLSELSQIPNSCEIERELPSHGRNQPQQHSWKQQSWKILYECDKSSKINQNEENETSSFYG